MRPAKPVGWLKPEHLNHLGPLHKVTGEPESVSEWLRVPAVAALIKTNRRSLAHLSPMTNSALSLTQNAQTWHKVPQHLEPEECRRWSPAEAVRRRRSVFMLGCQRTFISTKTLWHFSSLAFLGGIYHVCCFFFLKSLLSIHLPPYPWLNKWYHCCDVRDLPAVFKRIK